MKAYIFDLDGVIVHTDQYHYQAWKKLADRLGIPFDETVNNRLRGVSRADSLEIILGNRSASYTMEEKAAFMEEKNRSYLELLAGMKPTDVAPEVLDTLTKLKAAGHKIAIGSSSRNTKYILEKTGLLDLFDGISDGTNITKSKPDPEVFLKAASFLKEAPENCIVVEDAVSGIDAAKAAGMIAVGMGDAAGYERADVKIQHFEELLLDPE